MKRIARYVSVVLSLAPLATRLLAADPAENEMPHDPGAMPYTDAIPDPIEGFNRVMHGVNIGLFRGVLYPINRTYAFIVPGPVRKGITNIGHNLAYPVRLVNNGLQGKPRGAWDETKRFGVNTTVGLAGFFDVAKRWDIPRHDEDFGQTFGYYGHGPGFYLELPFFGPSSGRDTVGKILDSPFDLAFWLTGARPFFANNDLSFGAEQFNYLIKAEDDTYVLLRTLWAIDREKDILDYALPLTDGDPDPSLGALKFAPETPNFRNKAKNRSVRLPTTGKTMRYSFWLRKGEAPLALLLPGLGSHRLGGTGLALADLLYRNGYSVVTFSNTLHPEFMEEGATVLLPGFAPRDCEDVAGAAKEVLADLEQRYPGRFGQRLLVGLSMGGFQTLYLAANEGQAPAAGLRFDRYLAVNPAVNLKTSLDRLDACFHAPLEWPEAERAERIRETLYKAVILGSGELPRDASLPLSRTESRFLIGAAFRYTLIKVLANSQRTENLGVLTEDPKAFVRQPLYRELREISYNDYMTRFVYPYYRDRVYPDIALDEMLSRADLRRNEPALAGNARIRILFSEDDFILGPDDVTWLKNTFAGRVAAFPVGGHMGNLHNPVVQAAAIALLTE